MRFAGLILGLALTAAGAAAQDRAGDFDHYVLALSWSPAWCQADPDRRDAEQCAARLPFRFVVHGLWPQRGRDWPEHCDSGHRDPNRRETAGMADIMGSGGLAWHAWRKHGRCADLDPSDYFALTRAAAQAVAIPPLLRDLDEPARLAPQAIEDAFMAANPGLNDRAILSRCRGGVFTEIRICLSRDLKPVACARNDDCGAAAVLTPAP